MPTTDKNSSHHSFLARIKNDRLKCKKTMRYII